jgi:NADH dehydrogenase
MAGSVTVFGGTGFIGRHLLALLLPSGATLRLAVRHPGRVQMTIVPVQAPEIIQADVLDDVAVGGAVAKTDAVVNLIGILTETTLQTYRAIHRTGRRLRENRSSERYSRRQRSSGRASSLARMITPSAGSSP